MIIANIDVALITSIDVSPVDGNLVASGGFDHIIKVYDRRDSKIVRNFDTVNTGEISLYGIFSFIRRAL